nr:SNU116 [Diplonema papillatum]
MSDQYDEFGNFIGKIDDSEPEDSSSSSSSDDEEDEEEEPKETPMDVDNSVSHGAIVLHEDKQDYPEAEEVFGKGTEVVVGEEDTQPIEKAIIEPKVEKKFHAPEKKKSKRMNVQDDYIHHVMRMPKLIRNLTVAGSLGHGKTTFFDYALGESGRYTDVRKDEQERALSIKGTPVSVLMENDKGKNYLFNMMDTPGHVNFLDEVAAACRLSDGLVLAVDAIEGLMVQTEKVLKQALLEGLSMVLLITKMDRLILELKLPPHDAFKKLQHVIGELNGFIRTCQLHPRYNGVHPRFSPDRNNVCFSAAKFAWSFTLLSFAKIYAGYYNNIDPVRLAQRLWGEIYYDSVSLKFYKEKTRPRPEGKDDDDDDSDDELPERKLAFVAFILEPLYKIFAQVAGEDPKSLAPMLDEIGVRVWRNELRMDADDLLGIVTSRFFTDPSGFVSMVTEHIPDPSSNATNRVPWLYTGPQAGPTAEGMLRCDANGLLMVYVTKLYSRGDASAFDALGRVMSGTLRRSKQVRVLGEAYTEEDPEDMSLAETNRLWVPQGRHRLEIDEATAGMWVLIEGIDSTIMKTATICDAKNDSAFVFKPLSFVTSSVVKLAIEPLLPSDLPKMVEGLRKINKTYPLAQTRVEESGEHVIIGTGEMHLDSIMHDLRKMYTEIEVKVADPVTVFCETVIETSSLKCYAETPNKRNKITMIAEVLEKGLGNAIEKRDISLDMGKKVVRTFFEENYGWDTLAARSVWAFGPDTQGPNVLLDDTIASEVDKRGLLSIKDAVVQGFQWAAREGPLCDEQMRNVKFKLLDAVIASEPLQRGSGQIIPTARRVAYSAFLMATPRLMEPVYGIEITAPVDCLPAIYTILARRRGHIERDEGKPGTPLWIVKGFVPIMDSFGLETDLRTHTQGQAFVQSTFEHWTIVPGDPLDRDIVLRPLEPSQPHFLARDYMVKTRRRKGMTEDVSINKYFDDPMLLELARHDIDLGA